MDKSSRIIPDFVQPKKYYMEVANAYTDPRPLQQTIYNGLCVITCLQLIKYEEPSFYSKFKLSKKEEFLSDLDSCIEILLDRQPSLLNLWRQPRFSNIGYETLYCFVFALAQQAAKSSKATTLLLGLYTNTLKFGQTESPFRQLLEESCNLSKRLLNEELPQLERISLPVNTYIETIFASCGLVFDPSIEPSEH